MRGFAAFCLLGLAGCSTTVMLAQSGEPVREASISFGESYLLQSEILGDEREINVWTPPDFGPDRPIGGVLYLIDGGQEQDYFHIAAISQLAALSWTMDTFLVVGIETKNRRHELTPAPTRQVFQDEFPEAGGADEFRRFILDEVRPFIEARFETGSRNAIIGESLAGLFIADTMLKAPDSFDDFIAVSPSLWWDWTESYSAEELVPRTADAPPRRLLLASADEGFAMKSGTERFLSAVRAAPEGSVEIIHKDYAETERHETIFHQAALDAFRTLYSYPPWEGEPQWWLVEGSTPPAEGED